MANAPPPLAASSSFFTCLRLPAAVAPAHDGFRQSSKTQSLYKICLGRPESTLTTMKLNLNTNPPLQILAAVTLAALLCSCAATSVKSTWKSPEYHGGQVSKLATLAVDERPLLREGFENRLASQLRKGGATAITTINL